MLYCSLFMLHRSIYVKWVMSPIDDLVNLLRLNVELYHNARVCGDWKLSQESTGRTCFHMPSQGDCTLHVPNEGSWHLGEGDIALFPKEMAHTMAPTTTMSGEQQHLPIGDSQSIDGTSMLCGTIQFDHSGAEHLLSFLPRVLVVSREKASVWLNPLTALIVSESKKSHNLNNPVLNRLCEVLIAYTLRCFTENYPHQSGLFAVYTHPKLHRAINAIHKRPAQPWQLASLASEALMSRTQFSQLFTQVAGMTAIQYLTWWRMQLAYADLQKGYSVDTVAESVGYKSEAAFARAFKVVFNETVGAVRSQRA